MPIPSHAMAALLGVLLALAQLALPKGGLRHRLIGWGFLLALAYTAISAIFISDLKIIGRFSPIHLLIPITLLGLWQGVAAVRRGDIKAHRNIMLQLVVLSLILPGLFTLLPGRAMHDVVFGSAITGEL